MKNKKMIPRKGHLGMSEKQRHKTDNHNNERTPIPIWEMGQFLIKFDIESINFFLKFGIKSPDFLADASKFLADISDFLPYTTDFLTQRICCTVLIAPHRINLIG